MSFRDTEFCSLSLGANVMMNIGNAWSSKLSMRCGSIDFAQIARDKKHQRTFQVRARSR
jgi:hypothetical protein